MQAFDLKQIAAEQARAAEPWREFLRAPSLSAGVYHLQAGQDDRQRPHTEDEVYYILSGRAMFRAGTESQAVEAGTILFVERALEHRFYNIVEDLTALVFFATAEGSLQEVQ